MFSILFLCISICVRHAFSTGSWQQFLSVSVANIRVTNRDDTFNNVKSFYECAMKCKDYHISPTLKCVSFGYNEELKSCEVNTKQLDFKSVFIWVNQTGWKLWESHPCGLATQQSQNCLYMIGLLDATSASWHDDKAFCTDMGKSLVKVKTTAENAALNSALNLAWDGPDYSGFAYIGARKHDATSYVWTDGTVVTYTNFPVGFNPTVAGDGCVFVYIADAEGIWGQWPCTKDGSFVCQKVLN